MSEVTMEPMFNPDETPTLVTLTQTSYFAPSQWEGTDSNGFFYHIHYRYGVLTVRGARSEEAMFGSSWDSYTGSVMRCVRVGGPWDGEMPTEEMLAQTGIRVA